MLDRAGREAAYAEDAEARLEADPERMRVYSGIWYGNLALFALWLACMGYAFMQGLNG